VKEYDMRIDVGGLIYKRSDLVDGQGPWFWLKADGGPDGGAWQGPKEDWEWDHKKNILEHCKKFDTVVQAGGCMGMYPRLLADIFKTVYTFEPEPINFYILNLNTPYDNIIKTQAAVGTASGGFCTPVRRCATNAGMHQIEEGPGTTPIVAIDSLALEDLDLLFFDLEGYEAEALAGAYETIAEHKPVIIMETKTTQNAIDIIEPMGYRLVVQSRYDGVFTCNDK
jgi:FkbM family methyltransferase